MERKRECMRKMGSRAAWEREPAGVSHPLLLSIISWGRAISGKEMLRCQKCWHSSAPYCREVLMEENFSNKGGENSVEVWIAYEWEKTFVITFQSLWKRCYTYQLSVSLLIDQKKWYTVTVQVFRRLSRPSAHKSEHPCTIIPGTDSSSNALTGVAQASCPKWQQLLSHSFHCFRFNTFSTSEGHDTPDVIRWWDALT